VIRGLAWCVWGHLLPYLPLIPSNIFITSEHPSTVATNHHFFASSSGLFPGFLFFEFEVVVRADFPEGCHKLFGIANIVWKVGIPVHVPIRKGINMHHTSVCIFARYQELILTIWASLIN